MSEPIGLPFSRHYFSFLRGAMQWAGECKRLVAHLEAWLVLLQ